jgi:hypothetical protein
MFSTMSAVYDGPTVRPNEGPTIPPRSSELPALSLRPLEARHDPFSNPFPRELRQRPKDVQLQLALIVAWIG